MLGNYTIKRKTWALLNQGQTPNLDILTLCGQAISQLWKLYFLVLLFSYLFYISVHMPVLLAVPHILFVPLFTVASPPSFPSASLLYNHKSKFYHPEWHLGQEVFLDFPGTAASGSHRPSCPLTISCTLYLCNSHLEFIVSLSGWPSQCTLTDGDIPTLGPGQASRAQQTQSPIWRSPATCLVTPPRI